MWRLCELAAKYRAALPNPHGRRPHSGFNPMFLVDLIEANPKTKFILFHGGYPWVGETGAIAMKFPGNVSIDSCWLPTISYTLAKRAFHESARSHAFKQDHVGPDCQHAEGIYGATVFTRQCLAEVLAEKVDRGDLLEADAKRIGRQILRENALELFPQLRARLWKSVGKPLPKL